MRPALLHLYHALPGPLRSCAATMRGIYLRSWRYGAMTEKLVAEALDRERWSAERWNTWQQERLAFVLDRAATRVPYYRDYWTARRRQGCNASWHCLANWPILEKETVRRDPRAFLADDCNIRRMFPEHTSGTSGKPLQLWWSRDTVRRWYALFEARTRRWYGVSRADRWAILGGQLVTPVRQAKPPYWVWNAALQQLYLSSYHLSPKCTGYYFDALERYGVRYIFGYTSALAALAHDAIRTGRRVRNLCVAVANAEPVTEYQRRTIEEGLRCKFRETYGMAEIVGAASECEEGRLHLWPETGLLEVMEDGSAVPAGQTGDLVFTGLLNADMPLIRYRVGDRGALTPAQDLCACGRTMLQMQSIDGRIDDVLLTADGRRVGRLDPVFKTNMAIEEAQIIQESLKSVRVRYVPAAQFTAADASLLISRLQERMGPVHVTMQPVQRLERDTSGKFRAVICKLSAAERIAAASGD